MCYLHKAVTKIVTGRLLCHPLGHLQEAPMVWALGIELRS